MSCKEAEAILKEAKKAISEARQKMRTMRKVGPLKQKLNSGK
jgi:hypothetical protein